LAKEGLVNQPLDQLNREIERLEASIGRLNQADPEEVGDDFYEELEERLEEAKKRRNRLIRRKEEIK